MLEVTCDGLASHPWGVAILILIQKLVRKSPNAVGHLACVYCAVFSLVNKLIMPCGRVLRHGGYYNLVLTAEWEMA